MVVTGDIFDGQVEYTDALKNKAVAFFETLIKEINYNQENKKITKDDVIFVPGNHDLIRDNNEEVRWKKYSDFLQTLYGGIPDFYNSTNFSLYKEYKEQKIAFVGFNVSA